MLRAGTFMSEAEFSYRCGKSSMSYGAISSRSSSSLSESSPVSIFFWV